MGCREGDDVSGPSLVLLWQGQYMQEVASNEVASNAVPILIQLVRESDELFMAL